ncbi:rhodanese-like domain-containing protein 7 isoform X2 [Chenopodium quinoa]|uniref:rhodanese-like domain-containing protein 7 isoform X2 n=1 Tax=Chenopodium quinoa TaxID=63459 RepID=UPI000B776BBE|nr:rhodanese-like domain-containing protein 7 isoform X2 [Chenopodium quinoa]
MQSHPMLRHYTTRSAAIAAAAALLPFNSLKPTISITPFSSSSSAMKPTFTTNQQPSSVVSNLTFSLSSATPPNCFSAADSFNSELAASDSIEPSSLLVVVSFYKFADFPDHADFRYPIKRLCEELRVSGGIILAPEGINGSICGTREAVERVLEFIQSDERLKGLRQIESPVTPEDEAIHHGHTSKSPVGAGEDAPFRWDHVRVKLKKEIVSLGMPSVLPTEKVGTYISPKEWNELISDPNTVVIDVRNTYETRIGKFKGAVDPCTTAFREFPTWVEDNFQLAGTDSLPSQEVPENKISKSQEDTEGCNSPPRVAMYCTGGIRCEKASSYLLSKGFKEVYHLRGGILKYLEEVPQSESLWEGECFVFDKRVSVDHGLAQGTFKLCYGCKQPVSDADMESPKYEYGVSCPYCFSTKSEEEKERARARQRQFEVWGVIGGPDKGRRPTQSTNEPQSDSSPHMSKSV